MVFGASGAATGADANAAKSGAGAGMGLDSAAGSGTLTALAALAAAATGGALGAPSDFPNAERFGSDGAHRSSTHSNPRSFDSTNARAVAPGVPAGLRSMTPRMACFLATSSRSWQRCLPSPLRCASGATCKSRTSKTGAPAISSRVSPSRVKRKCAKATGLGAAPAFLDFFFPGGARSVTSANLDEGSQNSSISACGLHPCPSGAMLSCTSSSAQSSSSSVIVDPVRKCTSNTRPSRSYLVNAAKPAKTSRSSPSSSRRALRSVAR